MAIDMGPEEQIIFDREALRQKREEDKQKRRIRCPICKGLIGVPGSSPAIAAKHSDGGTALVHRNCARRKIGLPNGRRLSGNVRGRR